VFRRFTERARKVVVVAQDEARSLKTGYIGTEHMLLGLLRAEEGLAARVLAELGVDPDHVRDRIVDLVGEGEEVPVGQIPFTPRAKKVMELALRESLGLGHNYIGTEHLLLGLAREDGGVAARILLELDLDADRIRDAVIAALPVTQQPSSGGRFSRAWAGPTQGRVHWEYRVEVREPIDAAWLNELGAEGWELLDVSGERCIFKRRSPLPDLRKAG
jgi:ATP-dependent Clp protease ATP-binding subunit ClpC